MNDFERNTNTMQSVKNSVPTVTVSKNTSFIVCIGLFLLTFLTRIYSACEYLYDWDSIQLAIAIDNFNILAHKPHPPGYIFSVWSAKLLSLFLSPNNAYILLAIIATALTSIFIWIIAKRFFTPIIAFGLSLFWIFSPIVWFWSSIAATYALSPFFVVLMIEFAFRFEESDNHALWAFLLGFIMGIASGFRQDMIIFCGIPLVWFLISKRKLGLRIFLFAIVGFIIPFAIWFFASSANCGGVGKYLDIVKKQFFWAAPEKSDLRAYFRGLNSRINRLVVFLLMSSGIAVILILIPFFRHPIAVFKDIRSNLRGTIGMMLLFIIFPLAFFFFVSIDKTGYPLLILPGIIILVTLWYYKMIKLEKRHLISVIIIIIAVFNSIITIFLPESNYERHYPRNGNLRQTYDCHISPATLSALRGYENRCSKILELQKQFIPNNTILVCGPYYDVFSLRHAQYFFKDYISICISDSSSGYDYVKGFEIRDRYYESEIRIPEKIENLIIIKGNLKKENIENGDIIKYFRIIDVDVAIVEIEDSVKYGDFTFVLDSM